MTPRPSAAAPRRTRLLALAGAASMLGIGCGAGPRVGVRALTTRVERGPFELAVVGKGRVVPAEQTIVSCPQGFWGIKVLEVAAEGTQVSTGEVVLTLDAESMQDRLRRQRRQLEGTRLQLASLEARHGKDLSASETNREKKRLALETAEEKLEILLRGPRQEKVRAQEFMVEAGAAFEVDRRRKLGEEEQLRDRGFTSELSYLDARGELAKAEQRRQAAAAELALLRGGPRREERDRLEAEAAMIRLETAQTESAHGSKAVVQKHEAEEKRLEVASREGAVSREDRRLARTVVRATSSGAVLHSLNGSVGKRVDQGELLWSMQEVLRVARLDGFEVETRISSRDVERVRIGAAAELFLPSAPGEALRGKVVRVGKFAVPVVGGSPDGPKEFEVVVAVDDDRGRLRPNLSVRVAIRVEAIPDGYRVVREALACGESELRPGSECRMEDLSGAGRTVRLRQVDETWAYLEGEPPGELVRIASGSAP